MSSDLWAEFGSPANQSTSVNQGEVSTNQSNVSPSKSEEEKWETDSWSAVNDALENAWASPVKKDGFGQSAAVQQPINPSSFPVVQAEEDDDFGDFEEPEKPAPVPAVQETITTPLSQLKVAEVPVEDVDDFGDFAEVEPDINSTGEVALTNNHSDLSSTKRATSTQASKNQSESGTQGVDALLSFLDSAPDDPGSTQPSSKDEPTLKNNHSDVSSTKPATSTKTSKNLSENGTQGVGALLSFLDSAPDEPASIQRSSKVEPTPKWIAPAKKEVPELKVDLNPPMDEDDDWDDGWGNYNPQPSKSSAAKAPERKPPAVLEPYRDDTVQERSETSKPNKEPPTKSAPPPTNIPPPSVLAYYICTQIPKFPEEIRITIVKTWEEGEADVSKHLETMEATARIVAGRKLRWKRDTILSQSMKMGMAGRQGGMKLAGVDRAEMQREDREVSELIRTWRRHLGPIRSAMAESKSAGTKPTPLPAITETPVIRTAKPEEGGITAPRCCVLCGLKREERVEKVDREVWDQFGEYWTDHWGHTACCSFWQRHEARLR